MGNGFTSMMSSCERLGVGWAVGAAAGAIWESMDGAGAGAETGEEAAAEAAAAEEQLQLQVAAAEEQAGVEGVCRAGVTACFSLLNPDRKCEDCSSTWLEKSSAACKHMHSNIKAFLQGQHELGLSDASDSLQSINEDGRS